MTPLQTTCLRVAVTVGLCGVLLVGCATVAHWRTIYSSIPTLLPSETWSQTEDGAFVTARMQVRVVPLNTAYGREWAAGVIFLIPVVAPAGNQASKQERPFRIQVTFETTGPDFTFDPQRVTLASETIRPIAPTDPEAGSPRLLSDRSSFLLTFDTEAPDPQREFTLLLDGLARGAMPISPLRIRFKPDQNTERL